MLRLTSTLLLLCATRAVAGDWTVRVDGHWDVVGVSAQGVALRETFVVAFRGEDRFLACKNPGVGPRAVTIHVVPWAALAPDGRVRLTWNGESTAITEGARTFEIYASAAAKEGCTTSAEATAQLAAAKVYAKTLGIEIGTRAPSVSFGPSLAPAPPCDEKQSQATTTWVGNQTPAGPVKATVTSCVADAGASAELRGTVALAIPGVADERTLSFTHSFPRETPSEPRFTELVVVDNVLLLTAIDASGARTPFVVRLT